MMAEFPRMLSMVKVKWYYQTEIFTGVTGRMISGMEQVFVSSLMALFTKENGEMDALKAKVSSLAHQMRLLRVDLKATSSWMVWLRSYLPTGNSTRVTWKMANANWLASCTTLMATPSKASGSKIEEEASVAKSLSKTVSSSMANSSKIKLMAQLNMKIKKVTSSNQKLMHLQPKISLLKRKERTQPDKAVDAISTKKKSRKM